MKYVILIFWQGFGLRVKPDFLETCKAAEKQFRNLIPANTIDHEFIDFLHERFHDVKNMNEKEFVEYILNIKSEIYPNFLQYILIHNDHY